MILPGKIISGGQTGVDRAALDFAKERGIEHSGWAPKGWKAEDGTIPEEHRAVMHECRGGYIERTHRNVLWSSATLIILDHDGKRSPGSAMTIDYATKIGSDRRRVYEFRLIATLGSRPDGYPTALESIRAWLAHEGVDLSVLNIAGPRESKAPGVYAATMALLREVWP